MSRWWCAVALAGAVLGGGSWGVSINDGREYSPPVAAVRAAEWKANEGLRLPLQRAGMQAAGDQRADVSVERSTPLEPKGTDRPAWRWGIAEGDVDGMIRSWALQWASQGYRQELVRELLSELKLMGESEASRRMESLRTMGLEALLVDVMLANTGVASAGEVLGWVDRVSEQCMNSVACFSLFQVAKDDVRDFIAVREAAQRFEGVCGPLRTVEGIRAALRSREASPWCV